MQQEALQKAEAVARRRHEAASWLRQMDPTAPQVMLPQPSEEEFRAALRNGLILCNVLNRINPGTIPKVIENPLTVAIHSPHEYTNTSQDRDGAAHSAIQYFENIRNFLVAVHDMDLLTFEASDIEKGGASLKVVDCILCLKAYHQWKSAGSIGIWRYDTIVKIAPTSKKLPKGLLDDNPSSLQFNHQMFEFLQLLIQVSLEELKESDVLRSILDQFSLNIVLKFFKECSKVEECTVTSRLVELVLDHAFREFPLLLSSYRDQAMSLLKNLMGEENGISSKSQLMASLSSHLQENKYGLSPYSKKLYNNKESIYCQETQLKNLKSSLSDMKVQFESSQKKWEEDLNRLESCFIALDQNNSSYQKLLEENRALYNQVQDLKGNIRVYCRVRPFLKDKNGDQVSTVDHIGEDGDVIILNPNKHVKDSKKTFRFNKIFGSNTSQADVFADTQPLIRSVMDGYNVCIFAYGQTGSGKTYTMSGPDIAFEETWGVNYRALNDLFKILNERSDVVSYSLTVQMIEIYNEQVRDLLVSDGSYKRLEIRNSSQQNGLNIPDASLMPVNCTDDVLKLMKIGLRNRAVGATALNERSSRSHRYPASWIHNTSLSLSSTSASSEADTSLRGCLHLVDLAGSERIDKSEASGDRLNEAKHINYSLSALGDVVAALAQKSSHVPYRNSKLTQVLQDALGGQAKTLMFVHISPEQDLFSETLSTLKFAERVASIELGAARVNKESGHVKELKEEIARLKSALENKEVQISLKSAARQVASEPRDTRPKSSLTSCSIRKVDNSNISMGDLRKLEISSSTISKRRSHLSPSIIHSDSDYKTPINGTSSIPGNITSRRLKTPSNGNSPIHVSLSSSNSSFSKLKPKVEDSENSKVPSNISGRKTWETKENGTLRASCTVIKVKGQFVMGTKPEDSENVTGGKLRKTWFSKENSRSRKSSTFIEEITKLETEIGKETGNALMICGLQGTMKARRLMVSQNKEPRRVARGKEALSDGKLENRPPCSERNKVLPSPDVIVRRSRSLPRGKITARD